MAAASMIIVLFSTVRWKEMKNGTRIFQLHPRQVLQENCIFHHQFILLIGIISTFQNSIKNKLYYVLNLHENRAIPAEIGCMRKY
jgi:hypothetical protein